MRRVVPIWSVFAALLVSLFFSALLFAASEEEILVGGDHDFPPYEFLDEKGHPAGFNVDLLHALAEAMGLRVRIVLGPWSDVRTALEEGRIHMLMGMFRTEARRRLVEFSPPHTLVSHRIFVRRNTPIFSLDDLRGKSVLVQRGDVMHDFAAEYGLFGQIVPVETPAEALRLLASGVHDAALLGTYQGHYLLRRHRIDNVTSVGEPLVPLEYCFAVRKNDARLLALLTEGIDILRSTGRYDQIHDAWFGVLRGERGETERVLFWGALAVLLAVGVWWFHVLRRRMRRHALVLEEAFRERERSLAALSESEERYGDLVRNIPGAVYRSRLDVFCSKLFIGSAVEEITGYAVERFLDDGDLTIPDIMIPEDRQAFLQWLVGGEKGDRYSREYRIIHRDGGIRWILDRGRILRDEEGIPRWMEGVLFDITELKRTMENLEEVLRRRNELEMIIGRSPVVAILWRVGPEWPVEYVSENIRQFGYAPEEFLGGTISYWTLIHPEDRVDVLRETANHAEEGHREYIREYRFFTKSGDVRWIEERTWVRSGADGTPSHLQGILLDVTDRRKALEELEYLSLHDMLTGLYNRAYFEEEMRRLDSGRFDPLGIAVFDVDCLKLVNDTLGHAEGDRLLRRCAELLRNIFRRSDVVARIGGDEFVVLLPGCDERIVKERLDLLLRAVETSNGEGALYLSLSMGYAVRFGGRGSVWSFFREADDAMYRHKRSRSVMVRSIIATHLKNRMGEDISVCRDGDGARDASHSSMSADPQ